MGAKPTKATRLKKAIRKNDPDAIHKMGVRGVDVARVVSRSGGAPLFIDSAAQNGHVEVIEALCQHGVDTNRADSAGQTPLLTAAQRGQTEVVRVLCQHGADVNKDDNFGRTPLATAAINGHTDVVALLCENGADVNKCGNYGRCPLSLAADMGHVQVVSILCSYGTGLGLSQVLESTIKFFDSIIIRPQSHHPGPPVDVGAAEKFLKVVDTLLRAGLSVTSPGDEHEEILTLFLQVMQAVQRHSGRALTRMFCDTLILMLSAGSQPRDVDYQLMSSEELRAVTAVRGIPDYARTKCMPPVSLKRLCKLLLRRAVRRPSRKTHQSSASAVGRREVSPSGCQ